MNEVIIEDKLFKDISDYCELNQLPMTDYINHLVKQGFFDDKYGNAPFLKKKEHVNINLVEEELNNEVKVEVITPIDAKPETIEVPVVEKPKRGRKKKTETVQEETKKEEIKPKKRILK